MVLGKGLYHSHQKRTTTERLGSRLGKVLHIDGPEKKRINSQMEVLVIFCSRML